MKLLKSKAAGHLKHIQAGWSRFVLELEKAIEGLSLYFMEVYGATKFRIVTSDVPRDAVVLAKEGVGCHPKIWEVTVVWVNPNYKTIHLRRNATRGASDEDTGIAA